MRAFLLLAVAVGAGSVARAEFAADALAIATTVTADNALPVRDAVIPSNARLVAFSQLPAAPITWSRVHADGVPEALSSSSVASSFALAHVVDLGALSSSEGVSVQPSCGGCFDTFTFTVVDAPDTTAPAFGETGRTRFIVTPQATQNGPFTTTNGYFITGCLPRIDDDNGVLIQLDVEDGGADVQRSLLPAAAGSSQSCGTQLAFSLAGGDEREVCFAAAAVDVAANASEPQRTCVQLKNDDNRGCASSSSSPDFAAVLAVITGIGAMRRRRRLPRPFEAPRRR